MIRLQRADLEVVLGFLGEVSELDFDQPFPAAVLARLADVVPCATIAYEEIEPDARRTVAHVGIHGAIEADDDEDALYWVLGPCPIVQHRILTSGLAALRLSDVIDRRRYHELPIYRDYFASARIEYMIDVGLPAGPGRSRSLILMRRAGDGDFSERDLAVLEILRPHLARLEAAAALRRRLSESLLTRDEDAEPGPYSQLTAREREVVALVAEGKTNAQIASQLWVAPSTVKKHLEHVYEKLGVGRRTAAAAFLHPVR
jgi:DNA-binding CsgD family transcriptional regulator